MMHYGYAQSDSLQSDNLECPQTYRYTEYGGKPFLQAWQQHRASIKAGITARPLQLTTLVSKHLESEAKSDCTIFALASLAELCHLVGLPRSSPSAIAVALKPWVKTFEIRKRIYRAYNLDMKPRVDEGYRQYECYLLFAFLMERAWSRVEAFPYLNSFLKVMDTLASVKRDLTSEEQSLFVSLLDREAITLAPFLNQVGISDH